MSVSINNLFNYSRSLPVPFDTMTNKKVKVASMYGAKTESTLCGSVIKAVHAMCRCMNGTGEGAVGQIDTNKSVAEYKSSVGPDAYHLVVFDAASGSALASVYDKNTELIEQYVAHPSQRDGAAIFFALMPFLMSDAEFDETFQEYYDQFIAGYLGAFAPYGYMKSEDDHTKLEVDPYAAGIIQDIFRWKIEGMSQAAIAKRLTEQRVLAPLEYKRSMGSRLKCSFQKHAKVEWTAVGVGRILSNRVYTGTMIQGVRTRPNYKIKTVVVNPPEKWVVVEQAFEAIVSEKTFDLVQRLLKMDTRVSPGKNVVFPLAGMLFCADCGSPMVRRTITASAANKQICYACSTYKNSGACTSHAIPEQQLLDAVLALLQKHISMVVQMDECLKAIQDAPLQHIRARKAQERMEKAEMEEIKYRKLKASLYEDFKEDIIPKEDFLEIRAQYDSKITDALIAKEQVQRELNLELDKSGRRSQWVQDLIAHQNIPSLTRAVAVECMEQIRVYEDKTLEIEFAHAQDYAEMLAQVQESYSNVADSDKAVV